MQQNHQRRFSHHAFAQSTYLIVVCAVDSCMIILSLYIDCFILLLVHLVRPLYEFGSHGKLIKVIVQEVLSKLKQGRGLCLIISLEWTIKWKL